MSEHVHDRDPRNGRPPEERTLLRADDHPRSPIRLEGCDRRKGFDMITARPALPVAPWAGNSIKTERRKRAVSAVSRHRRPSWLDTGNDEFSHVIIDLEVNKQWHKSWFSSCGKRPKTRGRLEAWKMAMRLHADPTRGLGRETRNLEGMAAMLVAGMLVLVTPTQMEPDFEGNTKRYSKQEIHRAIHYYATQYRLDPALVHAVIKAESDFDPDAVSHRGAMGLMQLMPITAAALDVDDPFDPLQNIRAGSQELRRLMKRFRNKLPLVLAAYNAGATRVKGGKIPRIRETRNYVRKVLRYYRGPSATEMRRINTQAQIQTVGNFSPTY